MAETEEGFTEICLAETEEGDVEILDQNGDFAEVVGSFAEAISWVRGLFCYLREQNPGIELPPVSLALKNLLAPEGGGGGHIAEDFQRGRRYFVL